LNKLNILISRN